MTRRRRRNTVLVVTQWPFHDGLVQTYTLPYVAMIREQLGPDGEVVVVTQEPIPLTEVPDVGIDGVCVVSHPYAPFGLRSLLNTVYLVGRLVLLGIRLRPRTVHAFATPAGVPAYLASIALRVPLVLDSFEPHAESMVENGTWRRDSASFRILWWFERRQARRASAVVATTEGMRDYARLRLGASPPQFFVKPACVDLERFHPADGPGDTASVVCVYVGKIGGIYLDREFFEILAAGRAHWGDRFVVELLTDAPRELIEGRCREVGLEPSVVRSRWVRHAEVPDLLRGADFAINPVKPVPTKRYCTSIKDGEYWATGLPVLIPDGISDDSDVIRKRGIGVVLTDLTPTAYREAMAAMDALLAGPARESVRKAARAAAEELRSLRIAGRVYAELYG